MGKLETLVVPEELGTWLDNRELGEPGAYFSIINALYQHWDTVLELPVGEFIRENKKELIEVILGSREYKVEEPKYYALIKGHELTDSSFRYWNFDVLDNYLFVSNRVFKHGRFLTKTSKEEWNELGINDSNADFVKV